MTDLGVVDPLRPPASVVALGARLRLLPPYAIGFLGVLVARAIADLYLALRPETESASISIFSLILRSLPDWLGLLVPIAVGWSTVRLGDASPRVVRGAIAVGLSQIVAMGSTLIGGQENPTFALRGLVDLVAVFLLAGGLIWMAHGLEALRTSEPSSLVRRGALLAVAIGVVVAAIELVARLAQFLSPDSGSGDIFYDSDIRLANAMGLAYVLVPLAWTYLAWVLVRANGDPGRPTRATRLGAWAGWLEIAWVGTALVGLGWLPFAGRSDLEPSEGLTTVSNILLVAAIAGAAIGLASLAALVAGLATGLAAEPEQAAAAEPA